MNATEAIRRLRALPQGDILVDCIATLIDGAVKNHTHNHWHEQGISRTDGGAHDHKVVSLPDYPLLTSESHGESKTVRRPGKAVPTYEEVCINAAATLAEAGFPGYSPLDIEAGIKALVRLKDQIRPALLTAQASTRQHLEASSHRAQIAEHYRAALQRIAEGPASPEWRGVARDALAAPEWDKRIRP